MEAAIEIGQPQATPQTKRHFRKSSFARMCDKQEITNEMMRAAIEIERVYMALTAGLWSKGPSTERVSGAGRPEMALTLAWAHRKRYVPWANAVRGPSLSIIIDVLIDQWFIGDVAEARAMRTSSVKFLFLRGLLLYAVLAKWCPLSELTTWEKDHGSKRVNGRARQRIIALCA